MPVHEPAGATWLGKPGPAYPLRWGPRRHLGARGTPSLAPTTGGMAHGGVRECPDVVEAENRSMAWIDPPSSRGETQEAGQITRWPPRGPST